ncbi:Embryo defective protein [Quillaja saponaria]|uniref:Embryo defective protein n=1 Tax=Quillaja saponaria TaxID=32244 RepID=A0AAD7M6G7_QUISA|nr:Embryo defective protein [Quillaja saponaria]
MLTSTSYVTNLPLLPPVGRRSQCRENAKHTGFSVGRVCMQHQSNTRGRGQFRIVKSRVQSASVICAAASNARCAAGQTQTVTREAPTVTHIPGKNKSPQLDDVGPGFPPRDNGGFGGGGGGGGGNFSGGFFLFGFLGFLDFLKDEESKWRDGKRG